MEPETADTTTTTIEIDPECEELLNCLIDVVQDFLSARKVDLKNPEPVDDGWPDESLIHGTDYETLHDDFLETLENWGFIF